MALRDLIIDQNKAIESAIENLVRPYIRYLSENHRIVFKGQFDSLSIEDKILVYLVSMRGLKYLSGEAVGISSTDEIIETLYIDKAIAERAVEKLVRQKLLVIENGVYFVPVASLDAIRVRL